MIGTLIGLVNMLKDLQDSSAIGPSMATALLTTLYGSLIANWFCTPIANKLKDLYKNDKEELKKYTQILYAQARLIEGLNIENPTELSNLICEVMSK